jgi:hypothetical protein
MIFSKVLHTAFDLRLLAPGSYHDVSHLDLICGSSSLEQRTVDPMIIKLTIIKLVFWVEVRPIYLKFLLHLFIYLGGPQGSGFVQLTLFDISISKPGGNSNWLKWFSLPSPCINNYLTTTCWTQLLLNTEPSAPLNSFPSAEAMYLSADNQTTLLFDCQKFSQYATISGCHISYGIYPVSCPLSKRFQSYYFGSFRFSTGNCTLKTFLT